MGHEIDSSSSVPIPSTPSVSNSGLRRQRRGKKMRTRQWCVRASDEDAAVILGKADRAGVSVPRLLVSLAVGSKLRSSVERKATVATLLSLRPLLAGEANNLNQLAHWANTHHDLPDGFEELVAKIDRTLLLVEAAVEEVRKS